LLPKVCGTSEHCFITVHSIYTEGDQQTYSDVIFGETRHHTQAHVTSGALIHSVLYLATRRTRGNGVWWMISLRSAGDGVSGASQNSLRPPSVCHPIRGWDDLGLFPASSVKFLTRSSLKSLWVYLPPT
jgi:hypothetical protein